MINMGKTEPAIYGANLTVYAQAGVKGFVSYLIGITVAFFGSAVLTYIVGFEDIKEEVAIQKEMAA